MVKTHLESFQFDDWNERMIRRLEKIIDGDIPITEFDKRFYTHEIREYRRYKNSGVENGADPTGYWDNLHSATLEDYKINEIIEYGGKKVHGLYHPDYNIKNIYL